MAEAQVDPRDQIIGIARCTHCHKRFRIPQKHSSVVGKPIRCPNCREQFVVTLDVPSQVEQAAIQNSEQAQDQTEKRRITRRSKWQIREENLTRIREQLNPLCKQLAAICEQPSSEEQVRVWCIDVLRTALGYDNSHIDTEVTALGQRIDIALKLDGKIFLIIECKRTTAKLNNAVRDQAVMYTVNKGAQWAVATNGAEWKLWRVMPREGQDPSIVSVFQLGLLDEDGLSESDVGAFYLLTRRALFNGETLAEFHRQEAASERRLVAAMTAPRVVSAIVKTLTESYAAECGETAKLTDEFVTERIESLNLPDEL